METRAAFKLPPAMWRSMEPLLKTAPKDLSELQRQQRDAYGVGVFLRLHDGRIRTVRVDWRGVVYFEQLEGMGYIGDAWGLPMFAVEAIESWGHHQMVRQPSWWHPFKKVKVWTVRVWSDGQLNEPLHFE